MDHLFQSSHLLRNFSRNISGTLTLRNANIRNASSQELYLSGMLTLRNASFQELDLSGTLTLRNASSHELYLSGTFTLRNSNSQELYLSLMLTEYS